MVVRPALVALALVLVSQCAVLTAAKRQLDVAPVPVVPIGGPYANASVRVLVVRQDLVDEYFGQGGTGERLHAKQSDSVTPTHSS